MVEYRVLSTFVSRRLNTDIQGFYARFVEETWNYEKSQDLLRY